MHQIIQSSLYTDWFAKLRDAKTRAIIDARLRRLELGNAGDCEPVGEGVSEMRIHHGAGYRVYSKTSRPPPSWRERFRRSP